VHAPSPPGPARRAGAGCTTPRRRGGAEKGNASLLPRPERARTLLPPFLPATPPRLFSLRALGRPGAAGTERGGRGWYVPLPAALAVGGAGLAASSFPPGRRHEVRGCALLFPRARPGGDGRRGGLNSGERPAALRGGPGSWGAAAASSGLGGGGKWRLGRAQGRGRNGGWDPRPGEPRGAEGGREGEDGGAGLASLLPGPSTAPRSPACRSGSVPQAPRPSGSERGPEAAARLSAVCSGSRRGWPPASCAAARRRSGWIPTRPTRSPTPTRVSCRLPRARPRCASLALPSGRGVRGEAF